MSGVGFDSNINNRAEIYKRNLIEADRNHKEEVENIEKTHAYKIKKQKDAHSSQINKMEKEHITATDRMKSDQQKALKQKAELYDETVAKNEKEFHEIKRDNLRNWNKKFKELQETFDKNLKETKESDRDIRTTLENNYKDNVKRVRQTAQKDLDTYIESNTQDKKATSIQNRMEKNAIIANHEKERNSLLKTEMDKRNFMKSNAIKDIQDNRALRDKQYIDNKNISEMKFNKMNDELNARIDKEVTHRENMNRVNQVAENKRANREFTEKYDELSRGYEKNLRNLEYRKRAEDISNSEVSKQIQAEYKKNANDQMEIQRQTQMRERFDVEKKYSDRLRDTVTSYQNTLREHNIESAEKLKSTETKLNEINRQDKFTDRTKREKMEHDHRVALNYAEKQSALSQADSQKAANKKVQTLKENFSKSLEKARVDSQKNFNMTQEAMMQDKRVLEKRLHEQNSSKTAELKQMYIDKIDKMTRGYEKRIQELELQNKLIMQNSHDTISDMVRKTNAEIDRQRIAAQESAKTRVATERNLSLEKENALQQKIKNLEASFTSKMNKQTILNRKRLKDVTYDLNEKLNNEGKRYQDIIDQNNKFMARELQRVKVANDSEKQRLVTQYEDRIAQLKKVYQDKAEEVRNFKEVNTVRQA